MTTIATSTMAVMLSFIDVRCRNCNKLVFRWKPTGTAAIEVRCTRCSHTEVINLST